jgi:adenine-specific DNA-methyltransferase
MTMAKRKRAPAAPHAKTYRHTEAESAMRPDVGTQAHFKKKKPPATYRYDSSLSPSLEWDGQNAAREQGEALIREILEAKSLEAAKAAASRLKALGRPYLNWAGKAERLSFDVPTLPLFVHERLSTKAIIDTLKGHRKPAEPTLFDLFGDPEHPIADQVLKAYEHKDQWVNRLILGDNLPVMNSLLHFENLGGQVQMIYMDPPYGVKYGSNFQPFVRKRSVTHNDDDDLTREPEMVQAYRDTWEIGLHSYLTYLRDRLLLCRELLHPSGSVFVQISDENVHYVRELLDETFGPDNCICQIAFTTTTSEKTNRIAGICDYLLWYAKQADSLKFRPIFTEKHLGGEGGTKYRTVELQDGSRVPLSKFEESGQAVPQGSRVFRLDTVTSQRPGGRYTVTFEGQLYRPEPGYWKPSEDGFARLIKAGRIRKEGKRLAYVRYFTDFPFYRITNVWDDLSGIQSRSDSKIYSVQTPTKVIERCMLMTTDPGDLVLDPTCGSGSTAYVAEQWGRRWITIDVSRVPLALARQRLLTATFDWYELKDEVRGPAGGFVYKRKQNKKGEEVGGIVPHITLKSIANNEPPAEEVLVDRPEADATITRVTGPFAV